MADSRPKLIIIPGLGDESKVYYAFTKYWGRLGYDAHVISFNWTDTTAPLNKNMEVFLQQLDRFRNEPVYIIGISAGGTAAINALALRNNVKKVITVCSPLQAMPKLRNPLLAASIARLEANLAVFAPGQKQRILSVRALYDQVVGSRLSQVPGVPGKRILGIIHAPAIFIALVFYARPLSRFLKK